MDVENDLVTASLIEINRQPFPEPDLVRDGIIETITFPGDTIAIIGAESDGILLISPVDNSSSGPYDTGAYFHSAPATYLVGYNCRRASGISAKVALESMGGVARKAARAVGLHVTALWKCFLLGDKRVGTRGLVDMAIDVSIDFTFEQSEVDEMFSKGRTLCLAGDDVPEDKIRILHDRLDRVGGRLVIDPNLGRHIFAIRAKDVAILQVGRPSFDAPRVHDESNFFVWNVMGRSRPAGAYMRRSDAVVHCEYPL